MIKPVRHRKAKKERVAEGIQTERENISWKFSSDEIQ